MKKTLFSILISFILTVLYLLIFGVLQSYGLVSTLNESIFGSPFYLSYYLLDSMIVEMKKSGTYESFVFVKIIFLFVAINVLLYSIPIFVILKLAAKYKPPKPSVSAEPPPPPMF